MTGGRSRGQWLLSLALLLFLTGLSPSEAIRTLTLVSGQLVLGRVALTAGRVSDAKSPSLAISADFIAGLVTMVVLDQLSRVHLQRSWLAIALYGLGAFGIAESLRLRDRLEIAAARRSIRSTLGLAGLSLLLLRHWAWAPTLGMGLVLSALLTGSSLGRRSIGRLAGGTAAFALASVAWLSREGQGWLAGQEEQIFFAAGSASLADQGPTDSSFLHGYRFLYHWMTMAWSGALSRLLDVDIFQVTLRGAPAIVALVLATSVYGLLRSLEVPSALSLKVIAIAALTSSPFVDRNGITIFAEGVPTMFGAVCFIAALDSIRRTSQSRGRAIGGSILWLGVLGFVATGSKAMSGILLLIAVVGAQVTGIAKKTTSLSRGATFAGASTLGVFGAMWVFFDLPFTSTRGGARLSITDPMSFVRTSVGDADQLPSLHYWLMATAISVGLVLLPALGWPKLACLEPESRGAIRAAASVGLILAVLSTTDQFAEQLQFWVLPSSILTIFAIWRACDDLVDLSRPMLTLAAAPIASAAGYLLLRESVAGSGSDVAIRIRGLSVGAIVLPVGLIGVFILLSRTQGKLGTVRRGVVVTVLVVTFIFGVFDVGERVAADISRADSARRTYALLPSADERATAAFVQARVKDGELVAVSRPGDISSWRLSALCRCQMLASTTGFWGNVEVDGPPWDRYVTLSEQLDHGITLLTGRELKSYGVRYVILRNSELIDERAAAIGGLVFRGGSFSVVDLTLGSDR